MDETLPTADLGLELRRYWRMLDRQKWWVVGTTITVLVLTLALTQAQRLGLTTTETAREAAEGEGVLDVFPTSTTSPTPETQQKSYSTRIFIEPIAAPELSSDDIVTHAELLKSRQLAMEVVRNLNLDVDASALLEHLRVDAVSGSHVLTISYEAEDAGDARAITREFARLYLESVEDRQRDKLRRQVELLEQQLQFVESRLATSAGDVTRAALVGRLIDIQEELMATELEIAAIDRGRLVGPAFTDPTPAPAQAESEVVPSPSPTPVLVAPPPSLARSGVLGLFLGALLGIAVGLARELLDDRLRTRRIIEQRLNIPVLLVHPRVPDQNDVGIARAQSILRRMLGSARVVVTGFARSDDIIKTAELLTEADRLDSTSQASSSAKSDHSDRFLSFVAAPPLDSSAEALRLSTSSEDRMILVIDGETARTGEVMPVLNQMELGDEPPVGVFLYRGEEY